MQKYCLQRKIQLPQFQRNVIENAKILSVRKSKHYWLNGGFFGSCVCHKNFVSGNIEIGLPKCESFSKNLEIYARFLSAIFVHPYRNPSTEKLKALFDFVKVLVDFFPKESILMPYLKQLLSARSRITRGGYSCLRSPDSWPTWSSYCLPGVGSPEVSFFPKSVLHNVLPEAATVCQE